MIAPFSLGIRNLKVPSVSLCPHGSGTCAFMVNFTAQGDFLLAALGDNLSKTIDYSAVSRQVERQLSNMTCAEDLPALSRRLEKAIGLQSNAIDLVHFDVVAQCKTKATP